MKARTIVLVVAVLVLALGAAAGAGLVAGLSSGSGDDERPVEQTEPPSAESQVPPEPALEPFYTQSLDWEQCEAVECATLTVPVDYADPGGETIELNLKRTRASGDRVGSMVVNPGGPGAPGTTMVDFASGYFRAPLLEAFDVVGFDPRGTGASDPVDCLDDAELDAYIAADPTPDDRVEAREAVQRQADFFDGCVEGSGPVIGHVTTIETARDIDVLRAALGEEQLTYFGFSYGTRLGGTYAELFPDRVGRFVLDGAIDPSLTPREGSLSQAAGFQTALEAYVQNCVDQGTDGGACFLGDDLDEGLATISDLLDSIDAEPLPGVGDRELEVGNAFYGLVFPLYSEQRWPDLDLGLQQALGGEGAVLLQLSDLYGSRSPDGTYADNSLEAITAINCLDDPYSIGPGQVPAQLGDFEEASPTFGEVFAWGLIGCRGIEVASTERDVEIVAEGAAPILVVGTTRDPATPYEQAVALADQLDSGVLLTRDGDGHTGYNKGNACVDDTVEGYLVDGTVPDDGLEC